MSTSDLHVSTFVSMLETNIKVNQTQLKSIYDSLTPVPYENTLQNGLIKLSVLGNSKGLCKKMVFRKPKDTKTNSNTFRNQISSYVRINEFIELPLSKIDIIKKGIYYKGKRYDIENPNVRMFKKGQTAFQFNSIKLLFSDPSKVNTEDPIRLTTSVARKSQELNLKDLSITLTDEDIKKGFILIKFENGSYANALFAQSTFVDHLRIQIDLIIEANMFLFTSGKIKVAGCTTYTQIYNALDVLINEFKTQIKDKNVLRAFGVDLNDFKILGSIPVMINCGFANSYEIKRFELDNLIRNKYKVISSFEPNTHAACIIKYYSNLSYDFPNGRCQCLERYCSKSRCIGLGDASRENGCKIVTILVFQSGKIILTGARELSQVKQGYEFIRKIFLDNDKILNRSYM